MDRLSDLVARLSFTVLLAAFAVGSSVIVALQPGKVVDTMAEVLLAIATVVTVWWMISLLLGYRRRRR